MGGNEMSFDYDHSEQARISASDFAQMCEEMSDLRKKLDIFEQLERELNESNADKLQTRNPHPEICGRLDCKVTVTHYEAAHPECGAHALLKPDDGGPAFSRTGYECANGDWVAPQDGMTLRDWFAGQALAGLCASTAHDDAPKASTIADWAYQQADAMLEAREVKP
jgi:hypothetical protein